MFKLLAERPNTSSVVNGAAVDLGIYQWQKFGKFSWCILLIPWFEMCNLWTPSVPGKEQAEEFAKGKACAYYIYIYLKIRSAFSPKIYIPYIYIYAYFCGAFGAPFGSDKPWVFGCCLQCRRQLLELAWVQHVEYLEVVCLKFSRGQPSKDSSTKSWWGIFIYLVNKYIILLCIRNTYVTTSKEM